jgi:hypothetical protein
MKSIADLLREGDPVAADAALPEGEARRMRHLMLAHHGDGGSQAAVLWRGVAVLASIAVAAVALGTWLAGAGVGNGNHTGSGRLAQVAHVDRDAVPGALPVRQVQFVTPRGTRVVWVLQAETPGQEGVR